MRKNVKKVILTGMSGLLAAGLLVGSVEYASHMFRFTNSSVAKEITKVADKVETSSASGLDKEEVSKQETVYTTLDAYGNTTDVIVSDWLKNSGKGTKVTDKSDLTDIVNTKGDEEFTQNGDGLTWDTGKDDIYYQGKTDKKLPVGMEISYKLDGEDVKAEDIVGKSGKLEINIKYSNTSKKTTKINGKETDIYTPFIMITGMILPVDNFKNITIDNGNIVSEGDNNIIAAYGMPGLSESLDLNNLSLGDDVDIDLDKLNDKITDTVKITADVTDFEMKPTYTVATSEFFNDIDLDNIGDTDELNDKMDDMTDAAEKLVNGSDKLQRNLGKLDNKFGDYSDAIDTLHSSVKKLDKGADKVKDGVKTYTKGADKLLDGVNTYVDGTKTLAKGTKEYTKNTKKVVDNIGKLQTEGSAVLAQGSKTFDENLATYVNTINTLLSSDTMTTLMEGINSIHAGAVKLQAGTAAIQAGVTGLEGGVDSLNAAAKNITQYEGQVDSYMAELKKLYATAASEDEKNQIMAIMNYVGTAKAAGAGIEAATSEGSDMKNGFASVSQGLSSVSDGLGTLEQSTGSASAMGSLGDASKLKDAGDALVNAYSTQLDAGIQAVDKNLSDLYSAASKLTDNNKKLNSGADKLIKNASVIKKNIKKLTGSSSKLRSGAKSLANGTGKLFDGVSTLVNKTGDVSDAVGKLADGAVTLNDGVSKFKEDGVDKIINAVDELLDSGNDFRIRLNKIADASAEYRSFAGIDDSMEGSVKFIMSTEEVTAEED